MNSFGARLGETRSHSHVFIFMCMCFSADLKSVVVWLSVTRTSGFVFNRNLSGFFILVIKLIPKLKLYFFLRVDEKFYVSPPTVFFHKRNRWCVLQHWSHLMCVFCFGSCSSACEVWGHFCPRTLAPAVALFTLRWQRLGCRAWFQRAALDMWQTAV